MNFRLLFLLLLLPSLSFAQNTFQPGYYIENDGTRKEGLIYNIGWKNNPVDFEFKAADDAPKEKKNVRDIKEFAVGGYEFKRYTVEIERSSKILSQLSPSKDPQWTTETIFLKLLVKGKAELYAYDEGNILKFFYRTTGDPTPQQLLYIQYKADEKVAHNNKFRGQLFGIMKDSNKPSGSFKNIRYEQDELVNLFMEYNGSKDTYSENMADQQNKIQFALKVTPGMFLTSLSTSFTEPNVGSSMNFDTKPVLSLGIEAELILPFHNNKWSVFINPAFQHYSSEETAESETNAGVWKADYKVLEIPVGIRHYMFVGTKSKVFLDVAYTMGLNLGSSSVHYVYDMSPSIGYERRLETDTNSNLALGAGFSYDRYSIEIRTNFNRDILQNYEIWEAQYSSIGIILGYKIF